MRTGPRHLAVPPETTPGFNVLIHALGDVGVLALLTVPALESWVNGHVMAGAG